MNSVIHPSGPEPETTYWVRRAVVIGAALVALSLIWWVLSSLFGGGDDEEVTAVPQNPASLASPGSSATPTPSPASPSGSPSASPSASASASASASVSASASGSASASASAAPGDSASPSATPAPSSSPTPTGPVPCDPGQLTLAVAGSTTPTVGKATAITVRASNPTSATCTLDLADKALTLDITSGVDRIWSSSHCAKWQPTGTRTIKAGESWTWQTSWPTRRSRSECVLRPEVLKPGTYRATASIEGGGSDTLVMNLRS